MDDEVTTGTGLANETQRDTMHEPHPHASKRVILGFIAVISVFVLGGIIWAQWGERIEEVCFGDDESCEVILDDDVIEARPLEYDTAAFNEET